MELSEFHLFIDCWLFKQNLRGCGGIFGRMQLLSNNIQASANVAVRSTEKTRTSNLFVEGKARRETSMSGSRLKVLGRNLYEEKISLGVLPQVLVYLSPTLGALRA